MGGIEAIVGSHGHYQANVMFNHLDELFIRKWLITTEKKEKLELMLEKSVLNDHFTNLYGPRIVARRMIEENEKRISKADMLSSEKNTNVEKGEPKKEEIVSVTKARKSWRKMSVKRELSLDERDIMDQMTTRLEKSKRLESEICKSEMSKEALAKSAAIIFSEYGKAAEVKRNQLQNRYSLLFLNILFRVGSFWLNLAMTILY